MQINAKTKFTDWKKEAQDSVKVISGSKQGFGEAQVILVKPKGQVVATMLLSDTCHYIKVSSH